MVMDLVHHYKSIIKSVQTDANATTLVSEHIVSLNNGKNTVSEENSPTSVEEYIVSFNINTSHKRETYTNLVVMYVARFYSHLSIIVVRKI